MARIIIIRNLYCYYITKSATLDNMDGSDAMLCWQSTNHHVRLLLVCILVLGPDQNLVPIGVTKLYCDFQLDKYMRGLKMYDGLFRTVA